MNDQQRVIVAAVDNLRARVADADGAIGGAMLAFNRLEQLAKGGPADGAMIRATIVKLGGIADLASFGRRMALMDSAIGRFLAAADPTGNDGG